MALTSEMINLCRLHFGKNATERGTVGQIAVMEKQLAAINRIVRAQMLDPRAEQVACPPNDTVNRVTFRQQQLGLRREQESSVRGD